MAHLAWFKLLKDIRAIICPIYQYFSGAKIYMVSNGFIQNLVEAIGVFPLDF